jgi:hypothetical protein
MHESRTIMVQAVYYATVLSGRGGTGTVVTNGTLTQLAPDTLQFRYAPAPADKLMVKLAGRPDHELRITEVRGNLQAATPDAFLNASHSLAYVHVIPGQASMRITTKNVDGRWSYAARGSFVHETKSYQVDLRSQGVYSFENDMSGAHNKNQYTVQGKIEGDGLVVALSEEHKFELVSARWVNNRQRTVSHSVDVSNNTLTVGRDSFQWVDARIAKVFVNGKPSSVDRDWKATGEVRRNGRPFGTYRLDSGAGKLRALLVAGGEVVELESWNAY